MAAVSFINYSFAYPDAKENTLKNITLHVEEEALLLLCGATGSGKTTLLRSIKREIAPVGSSKGDIYVLNNLRDDKENKGKAVLVGFVSQNPENQIVLDSVWHELAFGLENMGLPPHVIRRRIAETVNFFGINHWINKKTCELSGGQKQILNLASIMAMQPEILIMDEPTSQLDPITAGEFIQMVGRVNRELGTTVIISEHRLENVLSIASEVVFMDNGSIKIHSAPKEFVKELFDEANSFSRALPSASQIAYRLGQRDNYPITVKQGKEMLKGFDKPVKSKSVEKRADELKRKPVLSCKNLWYKYGKNEDFVISDIKAEFFSGEIHSIVGGNGSGKSTLLHLLCGVFKPVRGRVLRDKSIKTGLLSQNPKSLFSCDKLFDELMEWSREYYYTEGDVQNILDRLKLAHLKDRHPYDLSGGEMQKAALGKILLLSPDILLLDEPTKGVDADAKQDMARIFSEEREKGRTIVIVTHDLDFAAEISDKCSMMLNGNIICTDNGSDFFCTNFFYTTGTNRITRGIADGCVTVKDVMLYE